MDATKGSSEGTPKGVTWDLYKDAQEGVFQVEMKVELGVTIELYLKICIIVHLFERKGVKECKKLFNKKVNINRHSMLNLRAPLRFHFMGHLKIHKYVNKKNHFTLNLMIPLTVQSRVAPAGSFDRAPKDTLKMMGSCELH